MDELRDRVGDRALPTGAREGYELDPFPGGDWEGFGRSDGGVPEFFQGTAVPQGGYIVTGRCTPCHVIRMYHTTMVASVHVWQWGWGHGLGWLGLAAVLPVAFLSSLCCCCCWLLASVKAMLTQSSVLSPGTVRWDRIAGSPACFDSAHTRVVFVGLPHETILPLSLFFSTYCHI